MDRLAALMRKAQEHERRCSMEACPLSLRSFIQGDVVTQTAINEELLKLGFLENDEIRQKALHAKFVVRIYFPRQKQAMNGVFI